MMENLLKEKSINNFKTEYRRGDVFWVDLGNQNKGSEQSGYRPAIIIQNNVGNKYSPTVIIAIISSQISKAKLPTHIRLNKEEYSWLDRDSYIALEQVRTVDKSRVKGFMGRIDADIVNEGIEISMGLKNNSLNFQEKVAKEKLTDIIELETFINVWVTKGKNIKIIDDIVKECELKKQDFISYINKFNVNIKYSFGSYLKNSYDVMVG